MPIEVEYEGTVHEFPDDFTQADIAAALESVAPAAPATLNVERPTGPSRVPAEQAAQQFWEQPGAYAAETIRNIPRSAVETGRGLAGTLGTLAGAAGEAGSYIGNTVRDVVGATPYYPEQTPNLDALRAMPGLMVEHFGNYLDPATAALQLRERPVETGLDAATVIGGVRGAPGAVRATGRAAAQVPGVLAAGRGIANVARNPIVQGVGSVLVDSAMYQAGLPPGLATVANITRALNRNRAPAPPPAAVAPPVAPTPMPRAPLPPVAHPPGWFDPTAPPMGPMPAPRPPGPAAAPGPTTTWPPRAPTPPPPGPVTPPPPAPMGGAPTVGAPTNAPPSPMAEQVMRRTGPPGINWDDPATWTQNRVVSVNANKPGGTGPESFLDLGDQVRALLKKGTPETMQEAVLLEKLRRQMEHMMARPAKK